MGSNTNFDIGSLEIQHLIRILDDMLKVLE